MHAKGYTALEFTTQVGCPNNCLKYCPQEVFVKAYRENSPTELTFGRFLRMIRTVPILVDIDFSGFSEPMINPRAVDMMEAASDKGHRLALYTTLIGLDKEKIDRLAKLKYRVLCIHLPDPDVFTPSMTPEFIELIGYALAKLPAKGLMQMGEGFHSNNRENIARGLYTKEKPVEYCPKHDFPQFEVLPNGDVHLCCMDFGLWHKIGNLLTDSYDYLILKYVNMSKDFKLCRLCSWNGLYKKGDVL